MWTYRATCLRWIDADTVDLQLDLGFKIYSVQRIRLAGLDAPALNAADDCTRRDAFAAMDRVQELLPVGAPCTVATAKTEKYGRWLGVVVAAGGVDLNAALLAEGLARPYPPPR